MIRRLHCLFWGGLAFLAGLTGSSAAPAPVSPSTNAALARHAREFRAQLAAKVLPYWYDTGLDAARGGYLLADPGPAKEKQLVTQARMIWGFAHAHRKGYSTAGRDYLKAAAGGYRFLIDHFLDRENGGYYWKTDLEGKVASDRKVLYGESFVVYALVEYHRASGDPEALRHAMDLYRVIQKRAHDDKHSGWYEHFTREWKPVLVHDASIEVEVGGLKSANTHLHFMEALAELYADTKDKQVGKSLAEALRLNQRYFYPKVPGRSNFHRKPDWTEVTDPKSAGLSYGHNVEFAWLMVRAEQVLGHKPSWAHFEAHLDHALAHGYDWERGGLFYRGTGDQPASDTSKVWWAEAELIAALSDALAHKPNPRYASALEKQIEFLLAVQIDPKDGIWADTVAADGKPKSPSKAHSWKANYHDVRGLVKFIEAFDPVVAPR